MELVINSYGSYLKREKGCFLLTCEDRKQKISPKNINTILITTGAAISSDAIQLALEKNIEIQFLDGYGNSMGKIWHIKLGSTTYIRRRQLEVAETTEGTELIKKLMNQKTDHYIAHLTDLGKKRGEEKRMYLEQVIDEIQILRKEITSLIGIIEEVREKLMGYEGNIAKKYFNALSELLPKRYQFDGRSRRPAKDEFNCLLNYGYGILYSKVEKACLIAGLDPYIGILHTDGYNKKSFVFDMIEPFRVYVDRIVMKLFSGKKVKKSYFDSVYGGVTLNDEGKRFFIQVMNEYFDTTVLYRERKIKVLKTIQYECHRFANQLIREDEQ